MEAALAAMQIMEEMESGELEDLEGEAELVKEASEGPQVSGAMELEELEDLAAAAAADSEVLLGLRKAPLQEALEVSEVEEEELLQEVLLGLQMVDWVE